MHPEAHAGFGRMLEHAGVDLGRVTAVLDIGGQHVNGSVHDHFGDFTEVVTLDLENADIIADARTWEPTGQFDLVIATEVFEHVAGWEQIVATAKRALAPDGVFVTTCASTHRQPHGATGAPKPARGEHYENIDPEALRSVLHQHFWCAHVEYLYPPGDAYAWAGPGPHHDITVVIPTIPGREDMLSRAVRSVERQDLPPYDVIVEPDTQREGPAGVRNRALDKVETQWVAFLDDDDEMHPEHLLTLARLQSDTGADVVWPWFTVQGGRDPFPMHRGRQWDPEDPHQIPITVMARHAAVMDVGGFRTMPVGPKDRLGNRCGEDWQMWLDLSAAGYLFAHTPEQTWTWHHGAHNTSGLPSRVRWDRPRRRYGR